MPRFVGLPRAAPAHRALGTPAMIMSSMGLVQAIVVFNMLARIGDETISPSSARPGASCCSSSPRCSA
jgi:hypothetical protein